MITLVLGPSGSGKSEFAENLAIITGLLHRYYIATMRVMDEEGRARRKRHRASREGKGFETLEIPHYIDEACALMTDPANSVVLLECVANLVGNAMHDDGWLMRLLHGDNDTMDEFTDHVMKLVTLLASSVGHLIVVSPVHMPGDVVTHTGEADKETRIYLAALEVVNYRLLRIADHVYEM